MSDVASLCTTIIDCELDHNAEHQVDTRSVTQLTRLRAAVCCIAFCALMLSGCSLAPPKADNASALREIARHDDGAELVVEGRVLRVLPTAAGPSGAHERFILQVASGPTALPLFVADNVSIAAAAPLRPGDLVIVKGELAFNDLGPVLHWTHRDPRLRHQPGFVEVGGHVYE